MALWNSFREIMNVPYAAALFLAHYLCGGSNVCVAWIFVGTQLWPN